MFLLQKIDDPIIWGVIKTVVKAVLLHYFILRPITKIQG